MSPPYSLITMPDRTPLKPCCMRLASCLVVGFVYNAAAQGIKIESLSFNLEGELDLQGFLGLPEAVSHQAASESTSATTSGNVRFSA